jgi:hypothetical protein
VSEAATRLKHSPIGDAQFPYRDKNGRVIQAGDILRGDSGTLWRVKVIGLNIGAFMLCRHNPKALEEWWLTTIQCAVVEVV